MLGVEKPSVSSNHAMTVVYCISHPIMTMYIYEEASYWLRVWFFFPK